MKNIFLAFFWVFLLGCGSSSSQLAPEVPILNESPFVSRTVILRPTWPSDLAGISSQLELKASLKGEIAQSKGVGSIGPVVGSYESEAYQFDFAEVPKELADTGEVTIDIFFPNAALSPDCQKVATLFQKLTFTEGKTIFVAPPDSFDLSHDCDDNGLSNIQEWNLSQIPQPIVNEPTPPPDIDADGIIDELDNCPLVANAAQFDADGDKSGDLCDCKPMDPQIYPSNKDEPDDAPFDGNCDGVDGDKARAVFVDATNGRDSNDGSLEMPLQTISAAVLKATEQKKDIYLATGRYDLKNVSFSKGLRFYGGYAPQNFETRDGISEWVHSESDAVLNLFNIEGAFLFDRIDFIGIKPENDLVLGSRTVVIEKSVVHITHSQINGSSLGNNSTALAVLGGSEVVVDKSQLDGGEGLNISRGILIDSSDRVTIKDNVIRCGAGRFCVGVEIQGASPLVQKNTIDATSRTVFDPHVVTVKALHFENALSLSLLDNILATGNADNRYPLYCAGLEPVDPEKISSNVLLASTNDGSNVWAVGCRGGFDLNIDDGLTFGLKTAQNNSAYFGALETLLEDPLYSEMGGPR